MPYMYQSKGHVLSAFFQKATMYFAAENRYKDQRGQHEEILPGQFPNPSGTERVSNPVHAGICVQPDHSCTLGRVKTSV